MEIPEEGLRVKICRRSRYFNSNAGIVVYFCKGKGIRGNCIFDKDGKPCDAQAYRVGKEIK